MTTGFQAPRPKGRRPKVASDDVALPVLAISPAQLWSCRKVHRVLSVPRAKVAEAVESGRLPCEPAQPGRRSQRVLAYDAIRVLAPAFLKRFNFPVTQ